MKFTPTFAVLACSLFHAIAAMPTLQSEKRLLAPNVADEANVKSILERRGGPIYWLDENEEPHLEKRIGRAYDQDFDLEKRGFPLGGYVLYNDELEGLYLFDYWYGKPMTTVVIEAALNQKA
ncbi:hypothetical protein DAEQUDRAFT_737348 [Daedalea quercina L-15889]|uniref:Uncharacterized protein n=1 Tax=Daedalea quercina L-15889 TaxID=1314783 RepID=A0A165R6Z9_9APHY|nr:hypothetical protein DAEQUDRAFT_737348 [Daedalea quercina L-15889]